MPEESGELVGTTIVDCAGCGKKFDQDESGGPECSECERYVCFDCEKLMKGFTWKKVPNAHSGGNATLYTCVCGNRWIG